MLSVQCCKKLFAWTTNSGACHRAWNAIMASRKVALGLEKSVQTRVQRARLWKMRQKIQRRSRWRHQVFAAVGTVESQLKGLAVLGVVACKWHDHQPTPPTSTIKACQSIKNLWKALERICPEMQVDEMHALLMISITKRPLSWKVTKTL